MEPEHNIRHGKLRTEEELQRLLVHCKPVLRALVLVLWDAGMRKGEVLGLRRDQVFKKANGGAIVELSGDDTKTEDPRHPHLTRRALEALEAIPTKSMFYFSKPNGEIYDARYLYTLFERARDKAGLTTIRGDTITLHSLRHSCKYTMRAHDHAPREVIKRQCGWKTDAAFNRYGDSDDEEVAAHFDVREARLAGVERIGPKSAHMTVTEQPDELRKRNA
jgi:integrase